MWLFVAMHIGLCAIAYVAWKKEYLPQEEWILPIVFFIPFWGFLLGVVHRLMYRNQRMGSHCYAIEGMRATDELYRQINVRQELDESITVPLEEAILINDAKTRRTLMLDILQKNPVDYIELLQRTKTSEDVELTHYATTTIMEVQHEFEQRLQQCEQKTKKHPEDEQALRQYLDSLKKYIDSGLLTAHLRLLKRVRMEEVLERLLDLRPENKEYHLLIIENAIAMERFDGVLEKLEQVKERWPEERVYRLFVRYYQHTGQGRKIPLLLQEIKEKNVYLSHEGKEWFRFWNKGDL